MSAHRLSDLATEFAAYVVVGEYSSRTGDDFVQHVAMLKSKRSISYGETVVEVCHMGPPLVAGPVSEAAARRKPVCVAHVAGTVDLRPEEAEGIKTWLLRVDQDDRPKGLIEQYIVKPHWKWERAKETNRRKYRRFSCAGFVVECYKSVGIHLVKLPDDSLPKVYIETVVAAYPLAKDEERRAEIGIPGSGPWRILLAGYVFHSLNREADLIRKVPYLPGSSSDAVFNPDQSFTTQTKKAGPPKAKLSKKREA